MHQFTTALIHILLVAALVEFTVMREPADASVTLAVVFMNAMTGFVRERRTERAREALRKLTVSPRIGDWIVIVLVAAGVLVAEEIRKLVALHLFNRAKQSDSLRASSGIRIRLTPSNPGC